MSRRSSAYDRSWEILRLKYLRFNPKCEVVGCGDRAEQVDHILTVRDAPHLRLEWTNLQALCWHHHAALTRVYDDGRLDGACDVHGLPLDPGHPWAQPDSRAAIEVANRRRPADPSTKAKLKRQYVRGKNR